MYVLHLTCKIRFYSVFSNSCNTPGQWVSSFHQTQIDLTSFWAWWGNCYDCSSLQFKLYIVAPIERRETLPYLLLSLEELQSITEPDFLKLLWTCSKSSTVSLLLFKLQQKDECSHIFSGHFLPVSYKSICKALC